MQKWPEVDRRDRLSGQQSTAGGMLQRLGNVLFWAGVVIAGAWLALQFSMQSVDYMFAAIPAAVCVGIGWALRYILAGPIK